MFTVAVSVVAAALLGVTAVRALDAHAGVASIAPVEGDDAGTVPTSAPRATLPAPSALAVTPRLSPKPVPSAPIPPGGLDCRLTSCVALTFDDGPGPYTQRLLDELEAAHATATFFLVGEQAQSYPAAVHREFSDGFEIGNHTWDHKDLTTLSPADATAEISRTADLLESMTGTRPTLLRPPYGAHNPAVDALVGSPEILWSVDTVDWRDRDAAIVASRAVLEAKPGAIILMHDIHPTTVDAVPTILQSLHDAGYTFVTVSQLLAARTLEPGVAYFDQQSEGAAPPVSGE